MRSYRYGDLVLAAGGTYCIVLSYDVATDSVKVIGGHGLQGSIPASRLVPLPHAANFAAVLNVPPSDSVVGGDAG